MVQNFQLSAGVSSFNIVNDSYLIIVYGEDRDNYAVSEFTPKQKQEIQNNQNLLSKATSGIETGVAGKIGMALWTSPVVQNLATKSLPNSVLSRVNSSLYDIMADGKVSLVEVGEDLIGNCTNILDNMATDLGFPSPSGLYSAIMPGGTGVPSKDFANLFAKKAEEENQYIKNVDNEKLSEPKNVLKFKIVTKDSETLASDIPTRKTENGIYLAQIIGNQNKTKNFTVSIVDNKNIGINMYQIKEQLEVLRDSKEAFNMYVCDSDVGNIELFKHCVFSNISIDTEGKNSLTVDLSVVIIPEYKIMIDTNLPKSLNKNIAKGNGSGKSRPNNPDKNNKAKSTESSLKNLQSGDKKKLDRINASKRKYLMHKDMYNEPKKSEGLKKIQAQAMMREVQKSTKIMQELDPSGNWNENKIIALFNSNFDFSKIGKSGK